MKKAATKKSGAKKPSSRTIKNLDPKSKVKGGMIGDPFGDLM
jgi:hypothetical protein